MAKLKDLNYKEELSIFGEADAQDIDPEVRKRFFGKYRGTVVSSFDPLSQGRLLVTVIGVSAVPLANYAMPCVPMAGPFMGTYFRPPAVGAGVWVEFEQGDLERPIWVGCFWGAGQTPPLAKISGSVPTPTPAITCETLTSGLSISDTPLPPGGNLNLHVGAATFVTLGADGVTIVAPTVKVVTPKFSVNGVALSVGLP